MFNSWLAWTHIPVFVRGNRGNCASECLLSLKREKLEEVVEPH